MLINYVIILYEYNYNFLYSNTSKYVLLDVCMVNDVFVKKNYDLTRFNKIAIQGIPQMAVD